MVKKSHKTGGRMQWRRRHEGYESLLFPGMNIEVFRRKSN